MSIELPLSRYRFDYEANDSINFPVQSGVLWHSVLGQSLKKLVCVVKGEACEQCLFLHQCDYTQLFRGTRPQNSEIMRKYDTIPAPHVLQSQLTKKQHFHKGEQVSVDVVLCGQANAKIASLVRALYVAGATGVGRQRSQLSLKQVTQHTALGESKALLDNQQLGEPLNSTSLIISESPQSIQLNFVTPYKPSGKAANNHGIDFGRLLMAIIRRVDLMQYFTTGVKLSADFKALKALTESIKVLNVDLDFHQGSRYSAASGGLKDTSGFIGTIEFDLRGHEALWPFIQVGQWLNVGKNSSMGFGRYLVSSNSLMKF